MTAASPALREGRTTPAELTRAVERAHAAFLEGRSASPRTRASWLDAAAAALEAEATALVPIAARETHLCEERLAGELRRTVFQFRLLAEEIRVGEHLDATIDHADPAWGMGPRPDIRRVNVPLGVVGVFGASNFPFAFSVAGGDTASALAAGCAVVHKGHDGHPELAARTAEVLARGLAAGGAPEGLFALVTGREAGTDLVRHPLVKAVGFTGSTAGGRALMDVAAARDEPIPFFGELGGINAIVVTPSAWAQRREAILAGYAASLTLGMGQFCTKPGLLLVPAGPDSEVVGPLSEALGAFEGHPLLTERLRGGFAAAVADVAGHPAVATLVEGSFGECPRPTVLTVDAADADPRILTEEMFGPAGIVVRYTGQDELESLVAGLGGQLVTGLHGTDRDSVEALMDLLAQRSGRVLWNAWPTGVTVSYAQHHGGPYPAASSAATSVGTAAIRRFVRPVAYQGWPEARLPEPLRDANPWRVPQRVDGVWQRPAAAGGSA
jgi:NADP-dependent aldehyde dehydrogenase